MRDDPFFISETLIATLSGDAEFAFLMGSVGTDRFQPESDIDIAVFWKSSFGFEKSSNYVRLLEEKFSRDVDLVSLNAVDVIFARQVLEKGRLLFSNSDGILLNWKMEKLSEYPDFKYSRKIIEDNILTRKKYV